MDVLVRRVAEAPGGDHERREKPDRDQPQQDEVRLPPVCPSGASGGHPSRRAHGAVLLADDEAGVVLVDVELSVEPKVLRVGAEKALDVGVRGQQLEALVLESPKVLAADLGAVLCVRELDVAAETSLPEAVADLEHSPHGSGRFRQRLVSDEGKHGVHPDRAGRGQCEHESEQPEEPPDACRPTPAWVSERRREPRTGPARERPGEEAEGRRQRNRCRGVQELVLLRPARRQDRDWEHGDREQADEDGQARATGARRSAVTASCRDGQQLPAESSGR